MTAPTLGDCSQSPQNNLDLIRFLLASAVCFTHSFNLLYGDGTDPLGVATKGAIGLGGSAVDMFFVISGFLVTKSWTYGDGLIDFIRKRTLRIYPAFLVVSLLCALVFGALASSDVSVYFSSFDPWKFIRRALLLDLPGIPETLSGVAFPNQINGSLWTIKYEFVCYLLVAVFGLLNLFRFRLVVLCSFIISLTVLLVQGYFQNRGLTFPLDQILLPRAIGEARIWPRFLTFFLAGSVIYLYRDSIPHSRWLLITALAFAPVLVLYFGLPNLAMPIFGAYIILYAAFSKSVKFHSFGKYGDYSYGVYLYAFPVQQLLAFYVGAHLTGLTMFVLSLLITVGFAVCSWYFIEKPCLRLKARSGSTKVDGRTNKLMPSGS